MTLIVYLVCLALLSFLLRNWSQRFRSLLITGFNLVFAALMFFSVQVHPGMTGGEVFALVGSILSAAPSAIAFQGDASLFGPDASYVFFLMSIYTVRAVLILFFRGLFIRIRMKWRLATRKTIYIVSGARKIARSADRQAEEIHQRYQHNSLFTPEWRELGSFTQASNRAAVWDIPNKLLLAGDVSGLTPQARETLFWELAQYEHLRWNAFHFARGWLPLPQEELTREEREQCRIKRPQEKRHACLVDWDQLDGLPQREPGILKRYDYENVAYLFPAAQEKA